MANTLWCTKDAKRSQFNTMLSRVSKRHRSHEYCKKCASHLLSLHNNLCLPIYSVHAIAVQVRTMHALEHNNVLKFYAW